MADSYQLKALLSAVDKITPVVKQVARNANKYLGDVSRSAARLGSQIGLPLAAMSGLFAAASLAGLKRVVTGFVTYGASIDDASKRTGIAGQQLQALMYVAEQADVSFEALQGAVGMLNKNIGAAAAGKNKDLAALFQRLNISLRGANGQLVSAVDVMPQLADAFARNTSATMRARMGTVAFGRSYQQLLPLLVEGSDGITKSMQRWHQVGFPLTQADIDLAARLDDQFVDLRYAFGGIGTVIGKTLAPVLSPLIEGLIKWASVNRDLIAQDVQKFVQGIADAIRDMGGWDGLYQRVRGVVVALRDFLSAIGGIKTVLITLAALLLSGPVLAFVQLATSVARAAAWIYGMLMPALLAVGRFFLANPWALAITALVVGAVLIYKNWDAIRDWFASFFDWVGNKWQQFTGWIRDSITAAREFLGLGSSGASTFGSTGGASGTWGAAEPKPIVGARSGALNGTVSVMFQNAPAGMQVVQTSASPGLGLDADVGYRSPFNSVGAF